MTTRRDGQLSRESIVCSLDLRQGEPAVLSRYVRPRFDDGGAEVSSGDEVLKRVPQVAEVLVHVEPEAELIDRWCPTLASGVSSHHFMPFQAGRLGIPAPAETVETVSCI